MILGMMRIASLTEDKLYELVSKAIDLKINTFDHADIYGGGKSEELFGKMLSSHPELREKIIIQTKCGICKGYYDSSKKHIIESVNESLARLNTNYIDRLLIHRPDILADLNEVAEAFDILYKEGKVREFGVSNMSASQIELLKKYVKYPLIVNQVQLSIVHSYLIDEYFRVNMDNYIETGLLEYLKLNDISMQVWSPLMASWEDGCFIDNEKYASLNKKLEELANKYNVSKNVIAISWLDMLPFNTDIVLGTTSVKHLEEMAKTIKLTKEEWYSLYLANNKKLP